MRNFRYIEPGHGRKSMTKEETDNAYIYLDIRTEDYYALMPVTKEEFNLVNSVEKYNREFPGVFEDSLMPAPEPEIPNDHINNETMRISSVVAERFMQMDTDIQRFIRQEIKAELNRREKEDDDEYDDYDD